MAKSKESQTQPASKEAPLPLTPPVREWFYIQLGTVLVVVIGLLILAWARPRACGDFFVALAAGRDIVETRLTCFSVPDTWSFMTTDRTWFDQNWGTHLLFYLTWVAGGEWGELLLKAGILAGMAFFITMRCRQRGVDWPIAILTGGATVAAVRAFIDMRPNLMTLMFAPLMVWVLLRTRSNPHKMWTVLVVSAGASMGADTPFDRRRRAAATVRVTIRSVLLASRRTLFRFAGDSMPESTA